MSTASKKSQSVPKLCINCKHVGSLNSPGTPGIQFRKYCYKNQTSKIDLVSGKVYYYHDGECETQRMKLWRPFNWIFDFCGPEGKYFEEIK